MFFEILRFELRYQLKRPLLWLVAFFFAVTTWGAISSDSVQIGGAIGNVHRNAPFVIVQMIGFMSSIGIFITTMFVAGGILRDFEHDTHELFFSRPVKKRDYLWGRFAGAYLVSCAAFLGVPLGILVGSLMPWLEPERLGPFMLSPYLWGLAVLGLPTLLFSACVFFSLASLSRSMLHTYMGLVGFFALYFLSGFMLQDLDNRFLAAMADPFGIGALQHATRYWTIVERNSMLPPLGGVILYNRLLWTAVALAVLGFTFARFRTTALQRGRKRRLWPWRRRPAEDAPASAAPAGLPKVAPDFGFGTAFRQFLHQTRVEVRGVLKGVPFRIILAFGVFNLVASSSFLDQIFGTPVWPVTQLMLRAIQGSYVFLLIIIVTFYAGELIWRERSVKLSEVYDAMPAPSWAYLGAKLMGQLVVVVAFLVVGVLAAMAVQAYRGYTHFEPGVYAQGFVVIVMPFLLICFLASFLQVAAGNKFLGYLLMILWVIVTLIAFPAMDYQHNLYSYAGAPSAPYSDMNGYGHFVEPLFWFFLYWSFCAAILVALSVLLWVRGTDTAWKTRLRIARGRFRGPVRYALASAALGFVSTGAWIFYNTNVLNEYLPDDKGEARQADYEKKFRHYKDTALPRVTDVRVDVDIFPDERRVQARGRYLLVNRNAEPLQNLHVSIPPRVTVNALTFSRRETNGRGVPHTETLRDEEHGYTIYRLEEPLAPGEEMDFSFDLTVANPGFRNNGSDTSIVYNGTFFNNRQYFPSFGYNEGAQLVDRNLRRRYDLPVVHRMAKVDDLFARRNTYIASDSDWIDFETTVSTSADQIAVAPGYLQREWTENGRRYFHYKMDAPILHFYSYLSARYEVKRDRHDDVAIEIYHHPGHENNLDRMIDSIKKSLDYFEQNFSPYQHRQMRILEFPRYASFAQSFPNTVPFSESIGFIARLDEDDEEALDYPFYVTAHEVAHQWWAHQVIGGAVQGSTMLSETFSQYSALMVMEKEYGPEKMRRFLKYELDRYLRDRGGELVEEMPLVLVENQPYIHYRKGSLVMYALREAIGEEALNRALAAYVAAVGFQMPPYTNSLEFMEFLRPEVPEDKRPLVADLLETITLFENRVDDASYAERADGTYAVTVAAKARKLRADGQGVETEIPLDDWIEVGVFGERQENGKTEETVLFFDRRRVTGPDVTFEVVVDAKPVRAGIDPYNKLVDRNSDDNLKRVSRTALAQRGSDTVGR